MSEGFSTESGQQLDRQIPYSEQTGLPSTSPSRVRLHRKILEVLKQKLGRRMEQGSDNVVPGVLQQLAREKPESLEARETRVLGWDQPPSRHDVITYLQDFAKPLRTFSQIEGQWEIVTSELVNGMADYFAKRASELGKSEQDPLCIIEVGAGSGRFAYFIQQVLRERGLDNLIKYYPTEGEAQPRKQKMGIIKPAIPNLTYSMDYKQAITLGDQPADIVLAIWPDPKVDGVLGKEWTKGFREAGVGEYVLIGNPRVCGHLVDTWGITSDDKLGRVPAYETDGLGYQKISHIDSSLIEINLLGASDNPNSDPSETRSQIAVFRKAVVI